MSAASPSTGQPPPDAVGGEVGSLADEAARLSEALADWVGSPSGGAGLLHGLDQHVATGADECRYCPVCRVIAATRHAGPEVVSHLADAAVSLMQVVRLVAEAGAAAATPAAAAASGHSEPGGRDEQGRHDERDGYDE